MLHTDVFICGGGPAGLAGAIACRLAGLEVVVAECLAPPVNKPCGEGLLPNALSALHRLGVDLSAAPTGPFFGIRFVDSDRTVEARFADGIGCGVRRTQLHRALRERAEGLGIRVLWSTQVVSLERCDEEVSRVTAQTTAGPVRARWCIGADGLQSRVRLWSELDQGAPESRRLGLRTHFAIAPWSEYVEVYWGRSGQAYVTPLAPDEVSLAVVSRRRYPSIHAALEDEFPALARRLRGVTRTSSERGAATILRSLPRVVAGSVALLGDASGSIDAVTGAGLGLAFEQAIALADAIRTGHMQAYERAHRAISSRPRLMARGLLLLDRFPALRAAVFAAFRHLPSLFGRMVALHTGTSPIALLGVRSSRSAQPDAFRHAAYLVTGPEEVRRSLQS